MALLLTLNVPRAVAAEAGDNQALETARGAVDNLASGDAATAKTRLRDALKFCRATSCSYQVYGVLYLNLGAVQLNGLQDEAKAKLAFDRAVELDHDIQLDPKVATPEAQRLLEAARAARPAPVVAATPAKLWARGGVLLDVLLVGSTPDACTPNGQLEASYNCVRADDQQYVGYAKSGAQGSVSGGPKLATFRLLLGGDMVLGSQATVGGSLGLALRGGPKPRGGSAFLPLHLEARGSYWFTGVAFPSSGVGVYGMAALGLAQVDSSSSVHVEEDTSVPPPPNQLDNPDSQELTAWKRTGKGLAALGAGAYIPLQARGGVVVELRASLLFPTAGFALSPAVYYSLGF